MSLGGHELDNQTVALCDEVSGTLLGGNASGIMGKHSVRQFDGPGLPPADCFLTQDLAFRVYR